MKVRRIRWIEKYSTEWYVSLVDALTEFYQIVISQQGVINPDGEKSSITTYSVSFKKDFQEEFSTLKEAKAFCQKHFKEFILSQIEVENEG